MPSATHVEYPSPPTRAYIHPQTLTLLGTYKCTAACTDCCFGSNPRITQRLDLPGMLAFIDEAAQYPSMRSVVFSGGECFLLGADLTTAVHFASAKGLNTRCVTNGYWAKALRHGRQRLQELKRAGLRELNISTGDFHQEWVREETVVNAAALAVELEIEHTVIMVELQKERRVTAATLLENPRLRALAADADRDRFRILESPWMPMDARATIDQPTDRVLTRDNVRDRHGCTSIMNTIVATPAGRLDFCCGLSRERIPELNVEWQDETLADLLSEAGRDFIKIWLFVDGPERILAWAASKNADIAWEGRYAHHCHACLALFDDPVVRGTIAAHCRERVDDVLMRYSVMLRRQELEEGAVYA
jgi:MoaA/NifB/PqqE/SkfB family radical SAM enzyme